MRRVLTVALMVLLVPCSDAMACSIAAATPQQRVQSSKLAVYVEVVSVRTRGATNSGATRWEATVRRLTTFKGRPSRIFHVRSHTDEASCGLAKFNPRRRIGLLLQGARSPFAIGLGSTISLGDLRRAVR
jgi:hypothetical protein